MAHTKRTARKSTGGKAPKKAQLTPKNKPKGAPKTTTKGAPKNKPKGAPKNTPKGALKTTTKGAPKTSTKGAPKNTSKGAQKTTSKGAPHFGHPSEGKFQDSTIFLKQLHLRAYFQLFNSFLGQSVSSNLCNSVFSTNSKP